MVQIREHWQMQLEIDAEFCPYADCNIVYFHKSAVIPCSLVLVPVFQKSSDPQRLVCYGQKEMKPQGRCCLENVRGVMNSKSVTGQPAEDGTECCGGST